MNTDNANIPVVILCGGQGTRIREVAENLPKPLIDIGGKPILWHIMKTYESHGFRRFILCLGYKGWDIKNYFLRYGEQTNNLTVDLKTGAVKQHSQSPEDWEVTLIDTGLMSGTGARIPKIREHIKSDYFMLTYGDGIGDVDVTKALDAVAFSDALGAVTGVHPTSRFGEVGVHDGVVTNFAEKPESEAWVSAGYFAFKTEFLDYFDTEDDDLFLEHAPLQNLTSDGKMKLVEHHGFWMGMDTFREYSALNEMWANETAKWKTW